MESPGQFTRQQRKVIELLLQGKSNKQIAALLHIAPSTIEFHLHNIYTKLEVTSRTEAVLKLSGGNPRETMGIEQNRQKQGKSRVDKTVKMNKNGTGKIQLWRQKMPYVFYVLVTLALLILLLGVGRLMLDRQDHPLPVNQTATAIATITDAPHSSPIAFQSPTGDSTLQSPTASIPVDTPTSIDSATSDSTCKGPMPARLAGPKVNLSLVNATKGNITVSMFLAKNKFGDCGYRSYTLARSGSINLTDSLPYGCYYTYAIINDPKNPTHVTHGPDCITRPDEFTFTVTYYSLKISPGP